MEPLIVFWNKVANKYFTKQYFNINQTYYYFTEISTIFNKSFPILSPIIVDCDVIKETGEYKAVLQVDINNSTGIFATSNSVHFHRSNVYDMSLDSDSSLSCSNNGLFQWINFKF